jgi:hypothetical protein
MSLPRLVALVGRMPVGWGVSVHRCLEHQTDWIVSVVHGHAVMAHGHAESPDAAADDAREAIVPILRQIASSEADRVAAMDAVEDVVGAAIARCRAG